LLFTNSAGLSLPIAQVFSTCAFSAISARD